MAKIYIAIMDYESCSVRVFEREFTLGADIEYELMQSGEFNPDTMYLMFSHESISVTINK